MPRHGTSRLGLRAVALAAGLLLASVMLGAATAGGPTDIPEPQPPPWTPSPVDEVREPFQRPFYQECALDVTPVGPGQACTTRELACTWSLLGHRGRCSLQTPRNDATCRMMNRVFPEVCPPPTGKPQPQGGECGVRTPSREGCPPCPPGGCNGGQGGNTSGGNLRLSPPPRGGYALGGAYGQRYQPHRTWPPRHRW